MNARYTRSYDGAYGMLMKACGALARAATRYRFLAEEDLFANARLDEDRLFFAPAAFFVTVAPRLSISLSCSSSQAWRIGEIR